MKGSGEHSAEHLARLRSVLAEDVTRLRRHGENRLNWLVMRPGWEDHYRDTWPSQYQVQVSGVVITFAVEDYTSWGPPGLKGKAIRVLSVAYFDVRDANRADGYRTESVLAVPETLAKTIANGFFEGEVDVRRSKSSGDWAFIQVVGAERRAPAFLF
jgi:hypothetical protein